MRIPILHIKICDDIKFDAVSLPCTWFLLGLSCAIAAMVAASTDWLYMYGVHDTTMAITTTIPTYQYRNGLFKICYNDGKECSSLEFGQLGPSDSTKGCYSSLNGSYAATAAFVFIGIAGCVISIWIIWRIWRHMMKGRPRRQKRNRRRAWISCALTSISFFIAFIIFIVTNGTSGCGVKYCDPAHCSYGAPLWFTLGIAVLCLWAAYIMYNFEYLMLSPIVTTKFAYDELADRRRLIAEEDREFMALVRPWATSGSRLPFSHLSILSGRSVESKKADPPLVTFDDSHTKPAMMGALAGSKLSSSGAPEIAITMLDSPTFSQLENAKSPPPSARPSIAPGSMMQQTALGFKALESPVRAPAEMLTPSASLPHAQPPVPLVDPSMEVRSSTAPSGTMQAARIQPLQAIPAPVAPIAPVQAPAPVPVQAPQVHFAAATPPTSMVTIDVPKVSITAPSPVVTAMSGSANTTIPALAPAEVAASLAPVKLRPYLGIEIQINDDEYGNKENVVMVHKVHPGGPADLAGLQYGDVLTRWNDTVLNSIESFAESLKRAKVGVQVTLEMVREGVLMQKQVNIIGVPKKPKRSAGEASP